MSDPDFKIWSCLNADLRRCHALLKEKGGAEPVSGWRLVPLLVSPRFLPIFLCRLAYWFQCLHLGLFAKVFSLANFVIFGIEIGTRCKIGPGLFLPHTQGTVIGAISIGRDATIFQGVTLGAKDIDISYREGFRPILGDGVFVGAGAKVLGGVTLGDRVRVGANAVVLQSIPADALAVGVPARIIAASGNTL